jgi:large subunit ribosomal protein L15
MRTTRTTKKIPTKKEPVAEHKPVLRRKEPAKGPELTLVHSGIHTLKPAPGSHKRKKQLGRGPGSGHGKTSSRGSKGQTSRAGRHFYLGFEGGQTPLIRRIPKRGFINEFRKEYQIVNLRDLSRITDSIVTPALLEAVGLIKDKAGRVKILGAGDLARALTVQAHAFSEKAAASIKSAGGKAEIIKDSD